MNPSSSSPRSNPAADGAATPRVVVAGTLNVDLVCRVQTLPRPGSTIIADSLVYEFGGKGANQAVAAARQGASVAMIGAVGDDDLGCGYREHLERQRIDVSAVKTFSLAPTGTAHVYVDAKGENSIVVNRGANQKLAPEFVREKAERLLAPRGCLLLQLESPIRAVLAGLAAATARGARSILNASPICADFPWQQQPIDTVIVNEHECIEWFGREPAELPGLAAGARAAFLSERRITNLVVSQGSAPTLWVTADGCTSVPTYEVVPRDTVGAGDTLAGVLAARLAAGGDWPTALRHANVAAALSTLAIGAQTAMPTYADVAAAAAAAGYAKQA